MKAAKLIPILLFALVFYGCKKSDQTPQNIITYTLNGNKYSLSNPKVEIDGGTLHIYALNGELAENILLSNYQKGSHDVPVYSEIDVVLPSTETYSCNQGTIVVTTLTQTHISGTFSGTVTSEAHQTPTPVTGTFDVALPQ